MPGQAFARKGDEAQAYWVLGGLYEVLVSSEESGGTTTVMRLTTPPGMGPPPHDHPGAEWLYVVEGRLTVHIGDDAVDAGPGASFWFPAGTVEWYEPQTQCTVLATYLPGGIDKFFAEVGEVALTRDVPPPSDTPPDFDFIISTAARYGMNIRPPG